jgi:hypothetical protein
MNSNKFFPFLQKSTSFLRITRTAGPADEIISPQKPVRNIPETTMSFIMKQT